MRWAGDHDRAWSSEYLRKICADPADENSE